MERWLYHFCLTVSFLKNSKLKKLTENQKRIYLEIDKIIWEDWNPIGLEKEDSADEYDGYLHQLFSLKINGADKNKIAEYLIKSDKEIMGMEIDKFHFEKIAEKITEI